MFFFRVLLCLPTICFCISGAPALKEFLLGVREEFIAKKKFGELLICIVVLFFLCGWGVIISVIYSMLLLLTVPVLSCSLVIYCLCCQALLIVTMKMLQDVDVGGVRKVVYEGILVVGFAGALVCSLYVPPETGTVWDGICTMSFLTSIMWIIMYWTITNGFDFDRYLFVFPHLLFFQALFWLIVEPFSWLLLFQFVCTIGLLVLEHFVGKGKSLFWIVCILGGGSVPLYPFMTPGYIDSLPRWIIAILSWGWT